ncbi:MAG: hypothetical protein IPO67_07830 [Deltaproteobacteria bacterium]|nr:hypothetical protein [Deltaproteobacteria bacterium]
MTFTYGLSPKPKDYDCQLVFNTTGTPTKTSCPECEWSLEFELVYNTAKSYDDGTCHDGSDLTGTFGYDADYYGYYEVVWYYNLTYSAWYPTWPASADGAGGLTFGGGYLDYPFTSGGKSYYYTSYWDGRGILSY